MHQKHRSVWHTGTPLPSQLFMAHPHGFAIRLSTSFPSPMLAGVRSQQ
ncbi:hypothetical protein E9229_003543 [Paeniglutamicibacter cryotolerans]|uniref:Uncharacterized protein n=1 Tax=Paeniglutamicibacter cryotolerans TaxID=670079 RepID=A0A839QTK0_9MICC|nr:hypothetical protein [Paeniglutamicibacter cryotolerans]